jgi:hypothetical protein
MIDLTAISFSRMMAYPYPKSYPAPSSSPDYTFVPPSFIAVVRRTYTIDGLAGFYRGLTPTILRAFPVNASALFVYEGVMRLLGAEEVRTILLLSLAAVNTHHNRHHRLAIDIDLIRNIQKGESSFHFRALRDYKLSHLLSIEK